MCPPIDPTSTMNPECGRFLDVCWGGTGNIGNPDPCQRQEFGADVTATNVPSP